MIAQSHQLSRERVEENETKGAERKPQAQQTLHLLPHFAEAVLGIQKENLKKAKSVAIFVPWTPAFLCLMLEHDPDYDTKTYGNQDE